MNDTCRYLIYIASTSWSIRESMPINLSISPDNKTYKNTFDLDYYDDLDLVVDECLFQNRWPRLSLHTEGQINADKILFDFMGQIILCITNMYGSREEDFLKTNTFSLYGYISPTLGLK